MYNPAPFAKWVPKPVMLILIAVIFIPIVSISGVYTSNVSDISGALATYPEYLSLANNASSIGMALSIMIVLRIKMRFRTKEIIVISSLALAALSYMCGTTDNPYVIVAGSFLIGFIKVFPLIEVVLPLMFVIAPTGDRGRFYAIFYPISIGFGQLSAYYIATLINESNYQAPYFIMSAIMLLIAVISIIFQHNDRFCFKKPLYQIDWLTLILLGSAAMSFNVCFTFMKQQAWFSSPLITGSFILGIVLFFFTVYRQKFLKRRMIKFEIFYKRPNVLHSIILLFFLGLFLASSSLYSQYSIGVLGYNNLINASINLWMFPGILLAGVLAFFGFKNKWNIKYFIAGGFISFFIHTLCLYLLIQPQMSIEYLQYTMIFKGLGMAILYIGVWFYATLNMPTDDMFGAMGILLTLRSFLVTAIGGAIIGWASYSGQWQSLSDISMYLDSSEIPSGMAIYQNISLNAFMASAKIILGSLCWMIVPILIFILTHHYGTFNFRRIIFFRKAIKGDSVKGYSFK